VGIGSAWAAFYGFASGANFSLITSNFIPSLAGDSLKFDHAYATYQTENDRLQISTSTDGGTTWTILITLDGGVSGPLVTAPPTQNEFVPTASQWATKKYALPVGTNMIKFTGISAYGNDLYLDNIKIGSPFPNDVSIYTIDAPVTNLVPGVLNVPKVTVKNIGSLTNSFPVTMTINPGGYSSTLNVTSLAPGASQQLTFPNWTPALGSYSLTVFAQLGSDQNKTNDTLKQFEIVSNINREALLEFATGTWCQYCPCGDNTADALLVSHPNMVVLAYHGPLSSSDPFVVFNGNNIIGLLNFSGYPTAIFDRQIGPGDYTTWNGYCSSRYVTYAPTAVTLNIVSKTFNSTTGQLDVSVSATTNCDLPYQYKISYVITEDHVIYPQTGNGGCPGSTTWDHKWIVRNMTSGATGENVNTGTWTTGQTITKTLSTTLNSAWIYNNCRLNIFIYKVNPILKKAEVQNAIKTDVTSTGIIGNTSEVPVNYELSQNYPNPFNPETSIKIAIPKEGFVSLKIYDVTGKEVMTGVNENLKAGYYNVSLNFSNLTSGVYFYKLVSRDFTETKKMMLVK
jgi:hypothetical protein